MGQLIVGGENETLGTVFAKLSNLIALERWERIARQWWIENPLHVDSFQTIHVCIDRIEFGLQSMATIVVPQEQATIKSEITSKSLKIVRSIGKLKHTGYN